MQIPESRSDFGIWISEPPKLRPPSTIMLSFIGCLQVFHLWVCRTRRVSFFRHGIHNMVCVYAVVIEILMILTFVYMPGVQWVMGASTPPAHVWYFAVGTGIALFVFGEGRKFFIRRWPMNPIVRIFKW